MPLDFNKPITTRSGRAVRILATDREDEARPVVAMIDKSSVYYFTPSGHSHLDGNPNGLDLINPVDPIEDALETALVGKVFQSDYGRTSWCNGFREAMFLMLAKEKEKTNV